MYDTRLFHKAKHIIIWGGNPIGWARAAITSYHLMEAQEKGTKLTDIGIVFDSTAAKVDEFIPINPGTDTALAFAMCNVMLKDNIWSSYFMANYTVAPFLVRDDNGEFLRESDIVEGGNRENFVFWNKVPIGPRFLAPHTKISEKDSPDLFAEVVVNGIPCKTAMVHIKNLVEPWTPETQEKITGIPADVVRKLTHEYVETENALIYEYYGPRYLNGGYYGRAVLLVVALSGQMLNEVGGFALGAPYSNDYPVALNNLEIVYPEGFENAKGKTPLVFSDTLRQGFPYKALLSVLSNPLQNWPNRDMWAKEIFPKLDLIVVHDYRMTDTAKFADYVLPDTTTFERNELYVPKGGYAILCEAAIEPVGEPKIAADFWFELSKRVGLEEYFHKSTEEWFEIMLQTSDPAIASLDPPLTLDRLKKEKMVKLDIPEAPRIVWGNLDFPTASGRIDLYCEFLADVGGALPLYVDPLIHGPAKKSYPLQFMAFRQRVMMQSQFNDLPHLLQIAGPKPDVAMNPADAKARGILSGDIVEVFNERGSFKAKVTLTNQLAPGMVRVVFAYPADSWDGDPPQKLMYPLGTPEMDDPVTMKWSQRSKTLPLQCLNFDALLNGWENLWDNLCEVRKV
jgi:molybdopterin-containing oxidoreductase family molybdopterin binding subunit